MTYEELMQAIRHEFDVPKIWEALYALNRAIDPDPAFSSAEQTLLVEARDNVWTVLQLLDPERAVN